MVSWTFYVAVASVFLIGTAIGVYDWMNLQVQPIPNQSVASQHITLIAKDVKFNATNPTLTVKVGSVQITVINQDTLPHDFLIREIPSAATGIINPGQNRSITVAFATTGTYHYYCAIHAGQMDGLIQVTGP